MHCINKSHSADEYLLIRGPGKPNSTTAFSSFQMAMRQNPRYVLPVIALGATG